MNPMTPVQKLSAAASGAIVAGILGVMLTAFGNAISGAPLGIWATIILAVALGAWFGRLAGAIAGATGGALLVALVGGALLLRRRAPLATAAAVLNAMNIGFTAGTGTAMLPGRGLTS